MRNILCLTVAVIFAAFLPQSSSATPPRTLTLTNGRIVREFTFDGAAWRTTRLSRGDGTAALQTQSDEFHVLLFDDSELTIDQYQAAAEPVVQAGDGGQHIAIRYVPRAGVAMPRGSPSEVTIAYWVKKDEPYLRKSVTLKMAQGDAVDRLEVERFSVTAPASRGGRGQPVFVGGDWFFGLEYPAFYSRHTDGNTPAAYAEANGRFGAYPSLIPLDGRDVDKHPRTGLLRLMHFPGNAKPLADGTFGILSKTAIAGVRENQPTMELAFMDYLATVRRPVRSFIHYNNWFDGQGKDLSPKNFAEDLCASFTEHLKPYGLKLGAMVPDNHWQRADSLFEPSKKQFPNGMDSVADLSKALEAHGSGLGLWIALDGSASLNMDWGKSQGYIVCKGFNYPHFSLAQPKYREAITARVKDLVIRGHLQYIKHDFNNLTSDTPDPPYSGHPHTPRHGHEACVDAEIDLLALERQINPTIYQNVTNYVWFSPWWLMHCDSIWMLSDDTGELPQPEFSVLIQAAAYRDAHLYKAWGNPDTRPLVPISALMTHGIIYTASHYAKSQNTLREFADHVMMYCMRGTLLKEWYINPHLLTPDQWEVLGRATRWSEENVNTLANAVMVGGDPAKGEPYGYMCWNGDKGILSVRNPGMEEKTMTVPFDASVWYRGKAGREFDGRVVYPWQGRWPTTLVAGAAIKLIIPAETVLVMHVEPGKADGAFKEPSPAGPPPASRFADSEDHIRLPDEPMQLAQVIMDGSHALGPALLDGVETKPTRAASSKGWARVAFDISAWRGRELRFRDAQSLDPFSGGLSANVAFLLLDRPVKAAPADENVSLPYPVSHTFRRQVEVLFMQKRGGSFRLADDYRPIDFTSLKSAKLRIDTFGLQIDVGGPCTVELNGQPVGTLASNTNGDNWETQTIDLPAAALRNLAANDTLRLVRPNDKDKFKFRAPILAVQRADGTWATTARNAGVQTSHGDWKYKEGDAFESPTRSNEVKLAFPAAN